jgi:pimeloyl-ACP methyl ester carboxylesterase
MAEPFWETHGGKGPHLLLVHGFLTSASQWLLNLDALKTVCQPVTVELFGHHRSPSPADPDCYRPDYYVRAFDDIRRELGAERWFLLGYSLGAGLTLRYAIEHPRQIIGHMFTNSTSGLADESRQAAFRESAPEAAERIRTGGLAAMERIPVHPRHARRLAAPIREALLADARQHSPEGIAGTIGITNPEVSMRARLKENSRPALLIQGVREKRFAPLADYARSNMPHLETAELEAGHGLNMEVPEAFNNAVIQFIERNP